MSSTAEEQEQGEATQAPAGVEAGKASHKRSRAGRLSSEITQEELSAYFHLPSEEACKQLGVGLTVLKRQCRRFGIRRWPFRKMKSLERLIENVETGLSSGTHARHLQSKSVDELLQQKQKLASCQVMDLEPDVKRLQQAFSKAHHKLRHMGAKPDLPPQAGGVSRPPSASSLGAQNRPDGGRPGFAPPDLSNGRPVPMLQASLDRSASSLSASQSGASGPARPADQRQPSMLPFGSMPVVDMTLQHAPESAGRSLSCGPSSAFSLWRTPAGIPAASDHPHGGQQMEAANGTALQDLCLSTQWAYMHAPRFGSPAAVPPRGEALLSQLRPSAANGHTRMGGFSLAAPALNSMGAVAAATAAAGPQGERTQLNAGSSYSGMAMAGPVPAARLRRPEGQAAFGGSHSRVGDAAGLAHDAATVTGGPDRAGSVASRIEPSQPPPQNHACQPGDSHGPAPAPAPVVRSSFMAQGSDRPRANSDAGTNAAAGTSPHTEPGPQSADMQPPKKYRRVGPGPAMLPPSNPTNPSALDPDHPPQRSPSMTDGASSRAARSQQPPQGASVQQVNTRDRVQQAPHAPQRQPGTADSSRGSGPAGRAAGKDPRPQGPPHLRQGGSHSGISALADIAALSSQQLQAQAAQPKNGHSALSALATVAAQSPTPSSPEVQPSRGKSALSALASIAARSATLPPASGLLPGRKGTRGRGSAAAGAQASRNTKPQASESQQHGSSDGKRPVAADPSSPGAARQRSSSSQAGTSAAMGMPQNGTILEPQQQRQRQRQAQPQTGGSLSELAAVAGRAAAHGNPALPSADKQPNQASADRTTHSSSLQVGHAAAGAAVRSGSLSQGCAPDGATTHSGSLPQGHSPAGASSHSGSLPPHHAPTGAAARSGSLPQGQSPAGAAGPVGSVPQGSAPAPADAAAADSDSLPQGRGLRPRDAGGAAALAGSIPRSSSRLASAQKEPNSALPGRRMQKGATAGSSPSPPECCMPGSSARLPSPEPNLLNAEHSLSTISASLSAQAHSPSVSASRDVLSGRTHSGGSASAGAAPHSPDSLPSPDQVRLRDQADHDVQPGNSHSSGSASAGTGTQRRAIALIIPDHDVRPLIVPDHDVRPGTRRSKGSPSRDKPRNAAQGSGLTPAGAATQAAVQASSRQAAMQPGNLPGEQPQPTTKAADASDQDQQAEQRTRPAQHAQQQLNKLAQHADRPGRLAQHAQQLSEPEQHLQEQLGEPALHADRLGRLAQHAQQLSEPEQHVQKQLGEPAQHADRLGRLAQHAKQLSQPEQHVQKQLGELAQHADRPGRLAQHATQLSEPEQHVQKQLRGPAQHADRPGRLPQHAKQLSEPEQPAQQPTSGQDPAARHHGDRLSLVPLGAQHAQQPSSNQDAAAWHHRDRQEPAVQQQQHPQEPAGRQQGGSLSRAQQPSSRQEAGAWHQQGRQEPAAWHELKRQEPAAHRQQDRQEPAGWHEGKRQESAAHRQQDRQEPAGQQQGDRLSVGAGAHVQDVLEAMHALARQHGYRISTLVLERLYQL